MRAQGFTVAEIATALGRKETQVRHRLRWDAITPAEKKRRSEASRVRQRMYRAGKQIRARQNVIQETEIHRPTLEMIRDRDARAMLPYRDLTAAFFNDPPLGLSALDGRR